jgi:hypothetical protein
MRTLLLWAVVHAGFAHRFWLASASAVGPFAGGLDMAAASKAPEPVGGLR